MYENEPLFLDRLTWPEIKEYIALRSELILPVGICEQHSLHLPLNTDTVVCEFIAEYLSMKTGILIAPTVPYGVGLPCDRMFTGTTSIRPEYLKGTISDLIDIWRNQGFQAIFILTAHGDPIHIRALKSLEREDVFLHELWEIPLDDILEKQTCAKHAGEAETSVMMFIKPDVVRLERMVDFEIPFQEFEPYLDHRRTDPVPDSFGGLGFPRYASAAKGERIVQRMKRYAESRVEHHRR